MVVMRRYKRRTMLALGAGLVAMPLVGSARALPGADMTDEGERFRAGYRDHMQVARADGGAALVAGPAGGSYVSVPRPLPARCTHLGVSWRLTPRGAPPSLAVRFRPAGGPWQDWRPVRVESVRTVLRLEERFGALAWTGGAREVQYRVEFPPAPSAAVTRVGLAPIASPVAESDVIAAAARRDTAPRSIPRRLYLPQLASDPPPLPAAIETLEGLVSREGWGADEGVRFNADGVERWHEMFVPFRKLVIHHTDSRNAYDPEEGAAEVRAIYEWHANGQGWGDIGYNALVDRYGSIFEGRHGRGGDPGDTQPRELLSFGVSGGHTKFHNYGGAGVALIGTSEDPGWAMDEPAGPMWDALIRYASFTCLAAGIRPLSEDLLTPAASDFLQSDSRWQLDAPNVAGHIAFDQTLCPGEPVLRLMDTIRQAIHGQLAGTSRTGIRMTESSPAEREVPVGAALRGSWAAEPPEPGWTLVGCQYRWEAWFKPADEGEIVFDDISYIEGFSDERQPVPLWLPAYGRAGSAMIVPRAPGQYTLQVRAVVQREGVRRLSAYAASRSWLVLG